MQSRVAIGSTRVAIGYAREVIVYDRVEIEWDRMGSGMDLGAIEYGRMEIGFNDNDLMYETSTCAKDVFTLPIRSTRSNPIMRSGVDRA